MKVIVVCGVHANETAAVWICRDLGKKKGLWGRLLRSRSHRLRLGKKDGAEYVELSRLAGRKITDNEVTFLNLSRYGPHEFGKRLAKISLPEIIDAYTRHIKKNEGKFPNTIKKFLGEYIELWKKNIKIWKTKKADLEKKLSTQELIALEENCQKLVNEYAEDIRVSMTDSSKSPDTFDELMLPSELKFLFENISNIDPEDPTSYKLNPKIRRELTKSANSFILDLHCALESRGNGSNCFKNIDGSPFKGNYVGTPIIPCTIFLKKHPTINFEKIKEEFQKIPNTNGLLLYFTITKDSLFGPSPEKFGSMVLEIPAPFINKVDVTERYKALPLSPNAIFFYYLGDPRHFVASTLRTLSEELYTEFVDPKFYKSDQFNNSKKSISLFIRDLLEWGEKWETMVGK